MTQKTEALDKVAAFFDTKIATHGATPEGLDFNSEHAQELRLAQVLSAVDQKSGFSINDVGCGYGHLARFMEKAGYSDFDFIGYDLSAKAIEAARDINAGPRRRFVQAGTEALEQSDYTVASGIFNKFMTPTREEWHAYVLESLETFFNASTKACASNFLTSYSDPERKRDDLYYPDPREIFDHCMKLTPWVSIHHDYGLYDFTVVMRRL